MRPASDPEGAIRRGPPTAEQDLFLTDTTFGALGLRAPLLDALAARGHTVPTPIQAQAIPRLMAGKDLLGIAQTGTGKTAAFALAILDRLLGAGGERRRPKAPRALILAPTRELAIQIGEDFRAYAKDTHLRATVIFGGVGQNPQAKTLARGVDVLVATPGRLMDLMNQRLLTLEDVGTFVLDEADRMLDMGFVRDVRKIAAALPKARQSLLFSATMPKEIATLAAELLHAPERVEIQPQSTPVERIHQEVRHVATADKPAALASLLADPAFSRVIVFTRTKHGADRVAKRLDKDGVAADAIHGNKGQGARQTALKRFRAGEARVLVATDIAARGIDVDKVTHVVNYDLPVEPESYVHRIGRTARAGEGGAAVSLCDPGERSALRAIERLTGVTLTPAGPVPAASEGEADRAGERRRRGGGGGGGKPRGGAAPGAGAEAKPRRAGGGPGDAPGRKRRPRPRRGGAPTGEGARARG